MAKKKQELFTDKYGITSVKSPISKRDRELLNQIANLLNKRKTL
jgi:hypothetical protein